MRQQRRKVRFEILESRRLFAVEVIYTFDAQGDLFVLGDAADDSITITEDEAGFFWEIRGTGPVTLITPIGLQINENIVVVQKPRFQNVHIFLDATGAGVDSLTMFGINQGTNDFIRFFGQTNIDMGGFSDTVNLGSFATPALGDFNFDPFPFAHPSSPNVPGPTPDVVGSNANDFVGTVTIDVGGGLSNAAPRNDPNSITILSTDFGMGGFESIGGRLVVEGSDGIDTVTIRGSNNFGGSFEFNTRAGADVVTLGEDTVAAFAQDAVTLGGSINLETGDGNDTITFEQVLTAGNITVDAGTGDDSIRFGSASGTPIGSRVGSSAGGNIVIQSGDGNDAIEFNQATTAGALLIALGSDSTAGMGNTLQVRNSSFGTASAGGASISGGAQADDVNFIAVNSPAGLHIQTGVGDDDVSILGTLVELGVCSILTGAGSDTVEIGGGSRFNTLVILTGEGNDTVRFGDTTQVEGNASVEEFFLDLGAGNDNVDSGTTTFDRSFVQGGSGTNTRSGQAFSQDVAGDFLFFEGF